MRVLTVVHGAMGPLARGAEVHAFEFAKALSNHVTTGIVFRNDEQTQAEYAIERAHWHDIETFGINRTYRHPSGWRHAIDNAGVNRSFEEILRSWRPDVVHFHHLTHFGLGLVDVAHRMQIPMAMTVHDYWLFCHRGQLLNHRMQRCAGPEPKECAQCAQRSPIAPQQAMQDRADAVRRVVDKIETFVCPSQAVRRFFDRMGVPASKLVHVPHGLDAFPTPAATPRQGPVRLGYVGSLMASKAPHLLLDAMQRLPRGAATLDVYGELQAYHGDTRYLEPLQNRLQQPGVRVHGAQPRAVVRRALASLDALVVPSVWPENAPLTILEAHAAGVAVVASDIGGLPELVRHNDNGLLFRPGDTNHLHASLARLCFEDGLLPKLRRSATTPPSMDTYAARMVARYRKPAVARSNTVGTVMVNYKTRELCRHAATTTAGLVIVNNDPTPLRPIPQAHIVEQQGNTGFPAAVNAGIRKALSLGHDAILLQNPDAHITPDDLHKLRERLQEPGVGIVGPMMMSDGRIQSAGIDFNPRTGRVILMRQSHGGERNAVEAAVMLIHRRVFDAIGMFDESYFFGYEDVDFCVRARKAGFRVVCETQAIAQHAGGGSLPAQDTRRFYYGARNQMKLLQVHGTSALSQWGAAALSFAHSARRGKGFASTAQGVRDHLRAQYGAGP